MMSSSWLKGISTHDERDHNINHAPQPRKVPITSAELDSLLSDSMLKLSPEQREIALEEINGIPQNNPEDHAAVQVWLDDLDYSINNIKRGTAYEVAELMDRQYVTSSYFRMMFLRSTRYDPQAAAEGMIKFFGLKRRLFGQAKLTKKITLDDLNEDELNYLKRGAYQILPSTDSAGRKIVLAIPSLREFQSPDNEFRARYYVLQSLAESQETQLTGITMVVDALMAPYEKGCNQGLLWNFPIHHASIHLCVADHGSSYVQNNKCIYSLPKIMRSRMRIHYGSYKDIKGILSRFGIPGNLLPKSAEISPSKAYNDQWFGQRCRMEQENDDAPSTMKPNGFTDKDVLLGHSSKMHIGNMYFRNLVSAEAESYEAARKRDKTLIAESILGRVKSTGARFLKKTRIGEWEELSDLEAREKVAKTFRNARRRA